jgi:membrane protein DedA with SNARE-associated domain
MINQLVDWLVNSIDTLGYPSILFTMFLESFIAPIPSQVVLAFSGFVASQGTLNIFVVIIFATLGAFLGTTPYYFIGLWGEKHIRKFLEKYGKYVFLSEEDVAKGYEAFEKHGSSIVFFGRLLPIVRSVVSFPAGMVKMNFAHFVVLTFSGCLILTSIICFAGYFLGESWHLVSAYVDEYERIIIFIGVIALLLYIWKIGKEYSKRSNK